VESAAIAFGSERSIYGQVPRPPRYPGHAVRLSSQS